MAVPDAIDDLAVVPGFSQATLTWTIPGDGGSPITDYLVEFSVDNVTFDTFEHDPSTANTIIVTGLENNQTNFFRVSAINNDGTALTSNVATTIPENTPSPEYCSVKNIADWLRIDIDENTDPNIDMVNEFILVAQDIIDRRTAHSWQSEKQKRNETHDIPDSLWDYGQGIPIFLQHRGIKTPFDASKGDKFEIWDGIKYEEQDVSQNDNFIHFEKTSGTYYIRGFFFTILRKKRFRITYRYGSDQENELIPRDIQRACILLVAIDILSTDFQMSQIPYGGEGTISKRETVQNWKELVNEIIDDHAEFITIP